jgi:hypothetical protein
MSRLGTNPTYGEDWDQEMVSKAIMSEIAGPRLGVEGSEVMTPADYLRLKRARPGLGQYFSQQQPQGYQYYGSPYPGAQPVEKSDWDKFMEFNNAVMPALSNVLGTWIQGRYQAQSAQSMADAFKTMTPQQQAQVMEAYMVNQMMAQQGMQPSMNQQQMNNLGMAFNSMPPQQFNQAYGMAMNNMQQAAGGSAGMQALINRTGAQMKAGGGFSIPGWVLAVGAVAVGAFVYVKYIAPKGGVAGVGRVYGRHLPPGRGLRRGGR